MIADIDEYIASQQYNASRVIKTDIVDKASIRYVAGLDISFDKNNTNYACAYITICDIVTNSIVYENYNLCKMITPYVSGCLGMREVPEYIKLLNEISTKPYYPQLIMVDGFGILHPRDYGSASELGDIVNIPTIGVAKTLMCIDGMDEHVIKKEFRDKCKKKGDVIMLTGESGKIYGAALKSSDNSNTPIYVSIGYGCSLETSIEFANKLSIYKIPEPIRNSDIKSKLHFH